MENSACHYTRNIISFHSAAREAEQSRTPKYIELQRDGGLDLLDHENTQPRLPSMGLCRCNSNNWPYTGNGFDPYQHYVGRNKLCWILFYLNDFQPKKHL